MACVFLFSVVSACFDLKPFIPTCWNMEIFDPTNDGEIQNKSFYHINITTDEPGKFSGHIYNGDCPLNLTDTDLHGDSLGKIEIQMATDQSGTLSMTEPDQCVLTEFNFVDTFTEFLGAYGIFNETLTYSANLVNLATLHVTFFERNSKLYREAILTVVSPGAGEPWYSKYGTYLAIAGVFALTFIGLQCTGPLIKLLGSSAEEKPKQD